MPGAAWGDRWQVVLGTNLDGYATSDPYEWIKPGDACTTESRSVVILRHPFD